MDIEKIQNAFSPSREINAPEFFVGHQEEVKNSILALSDKGAKSDRTDPVNPVLMYDSS